MKDWSFGDTLFLRSVRDTGLGKESEAGLKSWKAVGTSARHANCGGGFYSSFKYWPGVIAG